MNKKIIGATVTTPINPNKGGGGGTGQDGFSPIATVTETEEGALIEITDKNGKTSATVTNGKDGQNGQDGFSPVVNVFEEDDGYYISIMDSSTVKTLSLKHGKDGTDGQDGVSPLVSVSEGNGGHSVTIQDRFGDNTFFVADGKDGEKGEKGEQGEKGADGEDGYTPRKNFDYFDGQDGVGIQEIATLSESKADDGYSWYEIILTNGIRKQFSVKNGSKGSKGDDATVTTENIKNALGYTPANETHNHMGTYEPYGEASIQVVKHNMDGTSHSDIRTQISNLSSEVDAIVVPTKVSAFENDKGYLTSVPSEYVTETELSAKKYLTSVPSEYVTETELNAKGYAKQSDVDNLSSEIDDLIVPDYVKAEAKEVSNKIVEKRAINSLVLLMASDIHVTASETIRKAIQHMGMGMEEIRNYITPEAVVLLGDYVYDVLPLSKTQAIEDMMFASKSVSDATNGIPTIWMTGNHDYYQSSSQYADYRLSDDVVYALVGSHTTNTVIDVDNVGRNYGYVDFEKQRIRLIYLNTTDINGVDYSSHLISTEQGKWFVKTALDLSDKEDEEKWGVVVCSHMPLFDNPQAPVVLGNFKDRASGSNFGVSYDFINTKAELIAVFHGHIHNFKVTEKSTSGGNIIKYICIPNAMPDRENPYTTEDYQEVDKSGKPISYPKTENSAEDTSFNAVIIDRDNSKIHAICYGAGYDREISYGKEEAPIVNQIPISTDSSGAIYGVDYNGDGKNDGYKDGVRTGSDGADRTGAPTDATGFIPCTKGKILYFKNCQIDTTGSSTYQEISCYGGTKNYLGKISASALSSGIEKDTNGYLTMLNTSVFSATYDAMAFVRITGNYIGADSIITVDQPIT